MAQLHKLWKKASVCIIKKNRVREKKHIPEAEGRGRRGGPREIGVVKFQIIIIQHPIAIRHLRRLTGLHFTPELKMSVTRCDER